MTTQRAEPRTPTRRPATAHDRFRDRAIRALPLAILVSATLHLLVLGLSPEVTLPSSGAGAGELRTVGIRLPAPPPDVEVPSAPDPVRRPAPPEAAGGGEAPAAERGPAFIPHDVPPRLVNADRVRAFLRDFYPPVLRELGVEGRVLLWLYLDERGNVRQTRIRRSSGHPAFDELARTMAPLMRFRPALNHGRATEVWVSLPLRFELRPDTGSVARAGGAGAAAGGGDGGSTR